MFKCGLQHWLRPSTLVRSRPLFYPQKLIDLSKSTARPTLAQFSSLRTLRSPQKQLDELAKNTDFLHTQNILLQKNQQRLSKQKLLSEATNFYERFKIKTKWVLIRENRPFSTDEISTLFSWLVISQIVWIVLGTTTFVSLVLFTFNTVFAKEMVGQMVGRLLNNYIDGVDVRFQDALVPEWKRGCLSFKQVELRTTDDDVESHVSTDSTKPIAKLSFDLTFNQIDITLSFTKWFRGQGLINDLSLYGMKGDVSVDDTREPEKLISWFSNPKYHLGRLKIRDSRINVQDQTLDQNYRLSIYNMDLPQVRFEWALVDFFNANVVTGAVNHALFTIHKRQHKLAYLQDFEHDMSPWKRITRLRLDEISVKDLGLDKSKAFNWIEDGQVEIIADFMLPDIPGEKDSGFDDENKYVVMDLKFKFKDLTARYPSEEPKLANGDFIATLDELRPLIAFVNTQRGLFHSFMNIQNSNPAWNNIPNVSIKKNKSYPDTTVIPSNIKWPSFEDADRPSQEIIKYHDQPNHNNNEIVVRSRIVKNIDGFKELFLFKETGIYDTLCMEIHVDLMRMVEEWEHKKKSDWAKVWGTTVASQLMILGLGAMV
ncbi:LAME_0H18910g1_1 [Lachancea meyersii CBS 8951]|uniref:Mitochondrial distribution and morphology protein 32 n=1 Tax=Lachancea meyersii CBS 8951 TaxID=1266667 RepID=A0A1G4KJ96_9SACH|nr:LAME_0H18910g1_1 [Lachancea meyersii CBS 8951]